MSLSSLHDHHHDPHSRTDRPDRRDRSFLERFVRRELADLKSEEFWRAATAECVGSFLLVVITVAIGLGYPGEEPHILQVAIGVGFAIAVLITSLLKVSGGHVNPAISIGFLVVNDITVVRFTIYCVFQVTGGIIGAAFLQSCLPEELVGNLGLIQPHPKATSLDALGAETAITFFLLFVTMSMVDKGRDDVKGSVPFMVGLTVTVNILCSANISGGCMNPMRNFAPAVMLGKYNNIWLYWVGPMVGGLLGALVYDWLFSTNPMGPARCRTRLYDTVDHEDRADVNSMEKIRFSEK